MKPGGLSGMRLRVKAARFGLAVGLLVVTVTCSRPPVPGNLVLTAGDREGFLDLLESCGRVRLSLQGNRVQIDETLPIRQGDFGSIQKLVQGANDSAAPVTITLARSPKGVVVDAFDLRQVDLDDIESWPTQEELNSEGNAWAVARCQLVAHVLAEYTRAANSTIANPDLLYEDAHHQGGVPAENAYKADAYGEPGWVKVESTFRLGANATNTRWVTKTPIKPLRPAPSHRAVVATWTKPGGQRDWIHYVEQVTTVEGLTFAPKDPTFPVVIVEVGEAPGFWTGHVEVCQFVKYQRLEGGQPVGEVFTGAHYMLRGAHIGILEDASLDPAIFAPGKNLVITGVQDTKACGREPVFLVTAIDFAA